MDHTVDDVTQTPSTQAPRTVNITSLASDSELAPSSFLYLSVALVAGAVIALQIGIMRIFSVGSWAHFGSLVVSLAMLGFAATFLGNPVLTFLPLFAQNVLHGGVTQYTHLMSSAGAGAVTGALVVAWRGRFPHMGRTVLLIQIVFGAVTNGRPAMARPRMETTTVPPANTTAWGGSGGT